MKKRVRVYKPTYEQGGAFKPHTMYDSQTGEAYPVKSQEQHLALTNLGYTHKKVKLKMGGPPSIAEQNRDINNVVGERTGLFKELSSRRAKKALLDNEFEDTDDLPRRMMNMGGASSMGAYGYNPSGNFELQAYIDQKIINDAERNEMQTNFTDAITNVDLSNKLTAKAKFLDPNLRKQYRKMEREYRRSGLTYGGMPIEYLYGGMPMEYGYGGMLPEEYYEVAGEYAVDPQQTSLKNKYDEIRNAGFQPGSPEGDAWYASQTADYNYHTRMSDEEFYALRDETPIETDVPEEVQDDTTVPNNTDVADDSTVLDDVEAVIDGKKTQKQKDEAAAAAAAKDDEVTEGNVKNEEVTEDNVANQDSSAYVYPTMGPFGRRGRIPMNLPNSQLTSYEEKNRRAIMPGNRNKSRKWTYGTSQQPGMNPQGAGQQIANPVQPIQGGQQGINPEQIAAMYEKFGNSGSPYGPMNEGDTRVPDRRSEYGPMNEGEQRIQRYGGNQLFPDGGEKKYPKTVKTSQDSAAYNYGYGTPEKSPGGGYAGITLNPNYVAGEKEKEKEEEAKYALNTDYGTEEDSQAEADSARLVQIGAQRNAILTKAGYTDTNENQELSDWSYDYGYKKITPEKESYSKQYQTGEGRSDFYVEDFSEGDDPRLKKLAAEEKEIIKRSKIYPTNRQVMTNYEYWKPQWMGGGNKSFSIENPQYNFPQQQYGGSQLPAMGGGGNWGKALGIGLLGAAALPAIAGVGALGVGALGAKRGMKHAKKRMGQAQGVMGQAQGMNPMGGGQGGGMMSNIGGMFGGGQQPTTPITTPPIGQEVTGAAPAAGSMDWNQPVVGQYGGHFVQGGPTPQYLFGGAGKERRDQRKGERQARRAERKSLRPWNFGDTVFDESMKHAQQLPSMFSGQGAPAPAPQDPNGPIVNAQPAPQQQGYQPNPQKAMQIASMFGQYGMEVPAYTGGGGLNDMWQQGRKIAPNIPGPQQPFIQGFSKLGNQIHGENDPFGMVLQQVDGQQGQVTQYGGPSYEQGGSYEVTEDEVQQILAAGGTIEYI